MDEDFEKELGVWKGDKVYNDTKLHLGKYGAEWNEFAGRQSVGPCTILYEKIKPETAEDFYNGYIKDGEENPHNYLDSGRTVKELHKISRNYRNLIKKTHNVIIPIEDVFNNVVCHVIIETFEGQRMEKVVMDVFEKEGFTVQKGIGDDDTLRNIDVKVYSGLHPSNLLMFIQVKPHTTFRGSNNSRLINDRKYFFTKEYNCNIIYPNIPHYTVIYEKDTSLWLYREGEDGEKTFKFRTDELLDRETGLPKFDINDLPRQKDLEI